MTTFSQVYAALRRKNKGQYVLLAGCSFFSVLLITAYACMMRAPTILSVLPEGGDSRKQVMMVFVLAVIGCAVFTTYAAGLFFRQKSRETGVFLALGATRRQLQTELGKELALISLCSCAAGAILGGPLAWGIWQLFRLFLVDSQEMALAFDPEAYLLSFAFAAYVVVMLFLLGGRAIRRTNIIDIVQESHTSEPIQEVKRWCGPVGIILVAVGALAGYLMPSFFIQVLRWYPPSVVDAVFYLPALVGMYMMLLHTVVNGWRKRHKYRDIPLWAVFRPSQFESGFPRTLSPHCWNCSGGTGLRNRSRPIWMPFKRDGWIKSDDLFCCKVRAVPIQITQIKKYIPLKPQISEGCIHVSGCFQ